MSHDDKIDYMFKDLARRGVRRDDAAPLLYRKLWDFGIDVAPPLFAGTFWPNALIVAVLCLVLSAGTLTIFGSAFPFVETIGLCVAFSAGIGLVAATQYWLRSRALRLPRWSDYPGDGGQ